MAVGNPISLTDNVASRIISQIATESQTDFTISGGYRLNAISVYRNGVRLVSGRDYSATDGSTVVLLSGASLSDVLEFHIFDDFRVADAIVSNASHQNIEGNLTIAGILTVTTLNLTSLTVSDSISIGGTLTYEDVTNVDSIGIITARTDLHVGAGLSVVGVSTFGGNAIFSGDVDLGSGTSDTITIAGKLDSDLIPSTSDQKDLGSSSLKWKDLYVDGTGNIDTLVSGDGTFSTNLGIGTANPTNYGGAVKLALSSSGHTGLSIAAGTSSDSNIFFADGTAGDATYRGNIKYAHDGDSMRFSTAAEERLRIDANGKILSGIATARDNLANNASGVEAQVQIEGTSFTSSTLSIIRNSADANDGGIIIGKTRSASTYGNAAVIAGDDLGSLTWAGSDGTSLQFGAEIVAEVQSGVGNDDLPTDLIFKTNGGTTDTSERLRITSAGKVGIGTDNPETKLHVSDGHTASADNFDSNIVLAISKNTTVDSFAGIAINSGNNAASFIHFGDTDDSNVGRLDYSHSDNAFKFFTNGSSDQRLGITSDGKIGINQDTPTADLEVAGTTGTATTVFINAPTHASTVASEAVLKFGYAHSGSPDAVAEIKLVEGSTNSFGGNLTFSVPSNNGSGGSSTSEALRITSDGKIGIGNTISSALLTIGGNSNEVTTPSIRLLDGSDSREVSITNTAGDFVVSTHGTDDAIHGRIKIFESGIIDFDNGGASGTLTNRLRIRSDGQIDVKYGVINLGTADSSSGHMNAYENMSFNIDTDNDDTNRYFAWHINGSSASGTELMRLTEGGNIGIGTDNPSVKLHVHEGSVRTTNTAKNNFVELGTDGNIEIKRNGGGAYIDFADDTTQDFDVRIQEVSNGLKIATGGQDSTSERVRITSDGKIGIGAASPVTDVDISQKTGAVALPQGTTAQRPSGSSPYIRYNTTNSALEFYNGTSWVEIITDYFPTGSTILG